MHLYQKLRLMSNLHQIITSPEIKVCSHRKHIRNIYYHNLKRIFHTTINSLKERTVPIALRSKKPKSILPTLQNFVDIRQFRAVGGKGGDGAVSFLQLLFNDRAGPDGGDGGNGGHVILQVSQDVVDLHHVNPLHEADSGGKGMSKDCFGKNAEHLVLKVPVGTIVRNPEGKIVADLNEEGMMFIAARGGAGGHGNPYFKSDTNQAPLVCEYGAEGETKEYVLEIKSIAHIGLIGLPNAGKSTLLRAISRARPKVASYPFTTLKPHVGIIQYSDYEQIAVADLPGLIEDSHKNRGLGITFLKHAERCKILMFILDITADEPCEQLDILKYEISQFNAKLLNRPMLLIANKIDLPDAEENLKLIKDKVNIPIIPVSAKFGTNISTLLREMRIMYDDLDQEKDTL